MPRTLPLHLLLVLALALAGCGDKGGGRVEGADSPEALVEKVRSIAESKDFAGIVNLIAPDERPLMSLGALMLSQMAPAMLQGIGGGIGGEVAKAEIAKKMKPFQEAFDAALKKHGMDKLDKQATGSALMSGDPNAARKLLSEQAPSLDHGAFIADVIGALDKLGGEASGKATQRFDRLSGVLSELKIDGDKATGKINGTPAEFVKVAGRWYFSIKNQR